MGLKFFPLDSYGVLGRVRTKLKFGNFKKSRSRSMRVPPHYNSPSLASKEGVGHGRTSCVRKNKTLPQGVFLTENQSAPSFPNEYVLDLNPRPDIVVPCDRISVRYGLQNVEQIGQTGGSFYTSLQYQGMKMGISLLERAQAGVVQIKHAIWLFSPSPQRSCDRRSMSPRPRERPLPARRAPSDLHAQANN